MSLPWGPLTEPSLALSLLKSCLSNKGIDCDVIEAAPLLLQWVSYDTYKIFSEIYGLNDYLFTFGINSEIPQKQKIFIDELLADDHELEARYVNKISNGIDIYRNKAIKLRQEILPEYQKYLLNYIDFSQYYLVGFTCQFDQTWSSLAMAREIKKLYPDILIVLGGNPVSYSAAKPLLECFNDIDFIVSGDGEPALPELALSLKMNLQLENIPNLYFRDIKGKVQTSSKMNIQANLDNNPVPNFDHWTKLQQYMLDKFSIQLGSSFFPIESSRGCWWGEKHQCIFCGISKNDIKYREKQSQNVMLELKELSEKYHVSKFQFTDYIAPKTHFKSLFPLLKKSGLHFNLFFETKSNLTIDEISIASEAGVKTFQPGIESFSTNILKKMNKGVLGIQNIFCLFQMMRFGISPTYNIIYAFPGDKYSDYQWMLSIIPYLSHIVPPVTVIPVQMTQYSSLKEKSEYINDKRKCTPHKWYNLLIELDVINEVKIVDDIFYYYQTNNYADNFDKSTKTAFRLLQIYSLQWNTNYINGATLYYKINSKDEMIVYDNRIPENPKVFHFESEYRLVYEILLNGIFDLSAIISQSQLNSEKIRCILEELCEKYIILCENGKYVAIAFTEKMLSTLPKIDDFRNFEKR
jgi:ribosomal peptide maturation radical SAM protein 1